MNEWLIPAGALITVLGSYAAARYAGRSSVKVKELDVDAAAYQRAEAINVAAFRRLDTEVASLKAEMVEQRKQMTALRTDNHRSKKIIEVFANYVEEVLLWDDTGGKPPRPPIPDLLKPLLRDFLIGEHERQNRGP